MRMPFIPFLLLLAWPALARDVPSTPTGVGDPDQVVCRAPQILPGTRLLGPRVCKLNAQWARYYRDGMDVSADGSHDIPNEKARSTHPLACRAITPGGSGTAAMAQVTFGMQCE